MPELIAYPTTEAANQGVEAPTIASPASFQVLAADGSTSPILEGEPSAEDVAAFARHGITVRVIPASHGEGDLGALAQQWGEVHLAFKGAFDTPVARRIDASEYAQDARARLDAFNAAFNVAIRNANRQRERLLATLAELKERNNDLLRALEVIAVGDSVDPVRDAGDELVHLGHWSGPALEASRQAEAAPHANEAEPAVHLRLLSIIENLRSEDDQDAPVSSERKAGWAAALDAVAQALAGAASPTNAAVPNAATMPTPAYAAHLASGKRKLRPDEPVPPAGPQAAWCNHCGGCYEWGGNGLWHHVGCPKIAANHGESLELPSTMRRAGEGQ